MACSGDCTIRVYDIDISGLTISVNPVSGCISTGWTVVQMYVEALVRAAVELAHPPFPEGVIGPPCPPAVPPPAVPSPCVCIPLNREPVWTVWSEYNLTPPLKFGLPGSSTTQCVYTVGGSYYLAWTDLPAKCGDQPSADTWKRPKKINPAKEQEEGLQ
jgi:hypothetical protein